MSAVIDRRVPLRSTANFRDLGGLPVSGGTFVKDQVFRSAALSSLTVEDQPAFERLGIGVVYDLRTVSERESDPDRLPDGIAQVDLDVLADGKEGVAAAIGKLATDPSEINELLGGGKVQVLLEESYRDFVTLPSAHAAYRSLFQGIADEARAGAALFHCTAGKDRTGWAAASLLMLLGADDETIHSDYLQTNDDLLPTLEPLLTSATARGIDESVLRDAFGVQLSYLDAALNQLESQFGTVERYFSEGLGLDSATIDALRARLVE